MRSSTPLHDDVADFRLIMRSSATRRGLGHGLCHDRPSWLPPPPLRPALLGPGAPICTRHAGPRPSDDSLAAAPGLAAAHANPPHSSPSAGGPAARVAPCSTHPLLSRSLSTAESIRWVQDPRARRGRTALCSAETVPRRQRPVIPPACLSGLDGFTRRVASPFPRPASLGCPAPLWEAMLTGSAAPGTRVRHDGTLTVCHRSLRRPPRSRHCRPPPGFPRGRRLRRRVVRSVSAHLRSSPGGGCMA